MRRLLRWYGASPLHLLAMLACFGLAGYAAVRLIAFQPVAVAAWFLGAVIGHDLLLMPLYSLADRSVMAAFRHRAPELPAVAWVNYVRVPAALSGLLLLVWFPLILRLPSPYHASTTLSANPYVWHWLAVTGTLFLLSAVAFALRLRRGSQTDPPPGHLAATALEPAPDPGPRPDQEPGPEPGPKPGPEPEPEPEPEPGPEAGLELNHEPGTVERVTLEGTAGLRREEPAPEPAQPGRPADSER